jgi:hypothetical protein
MLDHKIQSLKTQKEFKSNETSICYNKQKQILTTKSGYNFGYITVCDDIDSIDNSSRTVINNHSNELSTKQISKMFNNSYKNIVIKGNGQVYGYTLSGRMDSIGEDSLFNHTNVTFDDLITDFESDFLNVVYDELMDGIENQTNNTIDEFITNHSNWENIHSDSTPIDECGTSSTYSNSIFKYSNYKVCEHYFGRVSINYVYHNSDYRDSYLWYHPNVSNNMSYLPDTLIGYSNTMRSIYSDTTKCHNIKIINPANPPYQAIQCTDYQYKVMLRLSTTNGSSYGGFDDETLKYSTFSAIMETLELNNILKNYTSFNYNFDSYDSTYDARLYHHSNYNQNSYTNNYVTVTPLANYGYHPTLALMRSMNNKYNTPTSLNLINMSENWIKSKIPAKLFKYIETDIVPTYQKYTVDFKFSFVYDSYPKVNYATAKTAYSSFSTNYNGDDYGNGIIRCFEDFKIGTKFSVPAYSSNFKHNCYKNNVYCKKDTFYNVLINTIKREHPNLINGLTNYDFIINSNAIKNFVNTKKNISNVIKYNRNLSFTDDVFSDPNGLHNIHAYSHNNTDTYIDYFNSAKLGNDAISITCGGGYTWSIKYADSLRYTYDKSVPTDSSNTYNRISTNKLELDIGIRDNFIKPIKEKLIQRIDNNSYTTTKPTYVNTSSRKQFINHHIEYSGAPEK